MLLRKPPLQSVAEAQRRARRRLPRPVYSALVAGRERGVTINHNVDTFDRIGFRTRVGGDAVAYERDMRTTLLGQELSMPLVLSPAGVQAIVPGGEVPAARAAASAGIAIGQSTFASAAFEDIAKANPMAFFQLYWIGSRADIEERVERMRRAGAKALILTMDAWPYERRDWGSPSIPERIDFRAMVRYAPMAASRPGWLLRFLLSGGLPTLRVPNLASAARPAPTFVEGCVQWLATPLPTWEDVRWLGELWGGPFMVKGILSPEDARRAVDAGATAISVSNHGGNNIDSTPSALRALPGIVAAVGDSVEIAYDGGVRRGGDVLKALALGARAVLVGRAYLFALAAAGERGVSEILEVFRETMKWTMIALGRESIHDVTVDDLFIPDDFAVENGFAPNEVMSEATSAKR